MKVFFDVKVVCDTVETSLKALHEEASVVQRKEFKEDKKKECNILFFIQISMYLKVFKRY